MLIPPFLLPSSFLSAISHKYICVYLSQARQNYSNYNEKIKKLKQSALAWRFGLPQRQQYRTKFSQNNHLNVQFNKLPLATVTKAWSSWLDFGWYTVGWLNFSPSSTIFYYIFNIIFCMPEKKKHCCYSFVVVAVGNKASHKKWRRNNLTQNSF